MSDTNTNCFTPDIQWSPTWTDGIIGETEGSVVKYNNKCYMVGASNVYVPIGFLQAEGSGLGENGIVTNKLAEAVTAAQEAITRADALVGVGGYPPAVPGTRGLLARIDPVFNPDGAINDHTSGHRLVAKEELRVINDTAEEALSFTQATLPLIESAQSTIANWVSTVNDNGNLLIEPYLYDSLRVLQAAGAAAGAANEKAQLVTELAVGHGGGSWNFPVLVPAAATAANNALTTINEALALFSSLVQPILSVDTILRNNINTAIFDAREGAAASLLANYPYPTIYIDGSPIAASNLNASIKSAAEQALSKAKWATEQVNAAYTSIQAWSNETNRVLKADAFQEALQDVQAAVRSASQASDAAQRAVDTITAINPQVLELELYQTYKRATDTCLINTQAAERQATNAIAVIIWASPEVRTCQSAFTWDPDDYTAVSDLVVNTSTGASWVEQNLAITPDNNQEGACLGWIEVQCCIAPDDLAPGAPEVVGTGIPVPGLLPAPSLPLTVGDVIEQEATSIDEDDTVDELPEIVPSDSFETTLPPIICPTDTEEDCDTLEY